MKKRKKKSDYVEEGRGILLLSKRERQEVALVAVKFPFLASPCGFSFFFFFCLFGFFLSSDFLVQLEEDATAGDDAEAQCCLGWAYEQGEGVEMDEEQAFRWYGKAADNGHAVAMFNLALMYAHGRGTAERKDMAVEYLTKAALAGHAEAMCSLGAMLVNGEGVESDPEKAVEWFLKSASMGNARAQNNLGVLCSMGKGVPMNLDEARSWYSKAASQGDAVARENLKLMKKTAKQRASPPALESSTPSKKKKGESASRSSIRPTEVSSRKSRARAKEETEQLQHQLQQQILQLQQQQQQQQQHYQHVQAPVSLSDALSGSTVSPGPAALPVANPEAVEAQAQRSFFIYDKSRVGSLSKEEFVTCWAELAVLDSSFAGQDQDEERLERAYDALVAVPEKRLSKEEFVAFYHKAHTFSLAKSIDLLLKKVKKSVN